MNFNYNYIDLKKNIFEEVINNNEKNVYIFNSYQNKKEAEKYITSPLFSKKPLFLTLNEFKEILFAKNSVLLREEKEVLMFYEALTVKDKEILKVDNYYDIIDVAANFLNFYKELNEYQVKKIKNLEEWQKEKYKIFEKIKLQYTDLLIKKGYTSPFLNNDISNINLGYFVNNARFHFMNILSFTPLEKLILIKLNKTNEINIHIDIAKKDYNEKELKIKNFTLQKELKSNVKIYEVGEPFLEIINVLEAINKNNIKYDIFDANFENNNYSKILSDDMLEIDTPIKLTDSKIYLIINSLYRLLNTSEYKNNLIVLNLNEILKLIQYKVFNKYFNINLIDIKYIENLINQDYKYFNKSIDSDFKESKEKFVQILKEIEKILKFKNLKDYVKYLENINLELLKDNSFEDEISKYFEALSEIVVIEDMNIVTSWTNYFKKGKISEGLFRLVLKYLRFKKIKKVKEEKSSNKICDIKMVTNKKYENLILMNITEGVFPSKFKPSFLLTESQRVNLGLKSYEMGKIEEKYHFFKSIYNSDNIIIFTTKNESNNIEISSFVEELSLKYKIEIVKPQITQEHYKEIIDNIFIKKDYPVIFDNEKDQLLFEIADFKNETLHISAYDHKILKECYYKFYLKKIARLEEKTNEIEYKIDKRLFGIIIHNILEIIGKQMKNRLLDNNFYISNSEIKKVLNETLMKIDLKLPTTFQKYYDEILFPIVVEAVEKFYLELNKIMNNEKISDVLIEKSKTLSLIKDRINVELSGRIDLVIETMSNHHLFDYKSGSGHFSQLDFYSILFYGESNLSKKYIYNIMDKKFQKRKANEKELTREILTEDLLTFIKSKNYSKTDKFSICKRCEFFDICGGYIDEKSN